MGTDDCRNCEALRRAEMSDGDGDGDGGDGDGVPWLMDLRDSRVWDITSGRQNTKQARRFPKK